MMDEYNARQMEDITLYQRHQGGRRLAAVASATALWGDLLSGRAPGYYLQEALSPRTPQIARLIEANYPGLFRLSESMTTSDFPFLTGDVLDRMMLANYRDFPSAWRSFAKVNPTLRDFRTVRRMPVDGLEGQWSAVAEGDSITYAALTEGNYTYAPTKYANGAKFSFEMLMNDDLGAFSDIPIRLGRGGARTVAKFATGLYIDANGPHASLYTAGNLNIVIGNPILSIAALNTAYGQLRSMLDTDGQPIMIEAVTLVVGPALEVTARNIVNATTVWLTTAGGASGEQLNVNNWLGSSFSVAVDPFIPLVATTANGATSWALFANPSVGRPALEVGFIRGFAEPQLYQKLSNATRVGGGADPMAGDFETMAQEYKGVIAFGGTRLDPKSTVASNGSNVAAP
jgi:Mu-like prophage major head subunit gpT